MKCRYYIIILVVIFCIYKIAQLKYNNICYIFGYGSLVNSVDRNYTSKTHAIPAIVDRNFGYVRSYEFDGGLGIKNEWSDRSRNHINGVIFKVNKNQLQKFDVRECDYDRIEVPSKYVSILSEDKLDTNLPIYAYKPKPYLYKNPNKVLKDYLIIVINGFKEYGIEFLNLFFITTENLNM